MKIEVTIKRITISFGSITVDARDKNHAAVIVRSEPELFISEWETAAEDYEVEQLKELP